MSEQEFEFTCTECESHESYQNDQGDVVCKICEENNKKKDKPRGYPEMGLVESSFNDYREELRREKERFNRPFDKK